jgi:serine O-acetyltransferase
MRNNKHIDEYIPTTVDSLAKCQVCPLGKSIDKGHDLAGQQAVRSVVDDLISVLFPGCHGNETVAPCRMQKHLESQLVTTEKRLQRQIALAWKYQCTVDVCENCEDCDAKAAEAVHRLFDSLAEIKHILEYDIIAAYDGDPAARSTMEVVMSYPGVYAIIVHRIANALYREKVPLIPRIMSEYAHSLTGIDIHPGATINKGFFIDHGTGVVIGETCVIGTNVKIYQGVTLGARSFEKDEDGNPVKGIKRHPDVGDNVVIYAGATILGGNTIIGSDSEIGGNVWLTHSVPPGSKVYNQQPHPLIKQDGRWKMMNGPKADFGAGI